MVTAPAGTLLLRPFVLVNRQWNYVVQSNVLHP